VVGSIALGHANLWAALREPAIVHGRADEYRAGLGIDAAHGADAAAGRHIACPTLLVESLRRTGPPGDPRGPSALRGSAGFSAQPSAPTSAPTARTISG